MRKTQKPEFFHSFHSFSRQFLACACGAGLALSLAGCGSSVPQPSAQAGQGQETTSLTVSQMQRIETQIHSVLDAADRTKDVAALSDRLSGPELEIRTSQLRVVQGTNKPDPRMILPTRVRERVLTQTSGWPRNDLVITSTTSDQQSERLLVLNQASARTNYKLWGLVRLFSGVTMPSFAVSGAGTKEGTSNDSGLVSTPRQAVQDYAMALNNIQLLSADKVASSSLPAHDKEQISQVAGDQFRSELADLDASVSKGVAENEGKEHQQFTPDLESLKIFRSAKGGDLVVARINSVWTRTAGNGRLSQPASDAEKTLFGKGKATSTMRVHYVNVVALYDPPASKGAKIRALGAERQAVSVEAVK